MLQLFSLLFNKISFIFNFILLDGEHIGFSEHILQIISDIEDAISNGITLGTLPSLNSINTLADKSLEKILPGSGSNFLSAAYDVLVPVGLIFVVIYFATNLVDLSIAGRLNKTVWLRSVILLALSGFIMLKGMDLVVDYICTPIQSLSDELCIKLSATSLTMTSKDLSDIDIVGGGLLAFLVFSTTVISFAVIIGAVLILIAHLVIICKILTRTLQIGLYIATLPLAMSNLFVEGGNSSFIRHIKKIISLCLQLPVILIMMNVLSATLLDTSYQVLFKVILYCILTMSTFSKISEYTDNLVGV